MIRFMRWRFIEEKQHRLSYFLSYFFPQFFYVEPTMHVSDFFNMIGEVLHPSYKENIKLFQVRLEFLTRLLFKQTYEVPLSSTFSESRIKQAYQSVVFQNLFSLLQEHTDISETAAIYAYQQAMKKNKLIDEHGLLFLLD